MKNKLFTIILSLIISNETFAGSITYHSNNGTASGFFIGPRGDNEIQFNDTFVEISISYESDKISALEIIVSIQGYTTIISRGTENSYTWINDTLIFHAVEGSYYDNHLIIIDTYFTGSTLTPGELPSTLEPLHGIKGYFNATREGGIGYGGSSGMAYGSFISAPEPSSWILLCVGIIYSTIKYYKRKN